MIHDVDTEIISFDGQLSSTAIELDFASIPNRTLSSYKELIFSNTYSSKVLITAFSVRGEFLVDQSHVLNVVEPGENFTVRIYFVPTKVGNHEGSLTIGTTNQQIEIKLLGIATSKGNEMSSEIVIDNSLDATSTNPVSNKAVCSGLITKAAVEHTHVATDISGLADIATTGNWVDLKNVPTYVSTVNGIAPTEGNVNVEFTLAEIKEAVILKHVNTSLTANSSIIINLGDPVFSNADYLLSIFQSDDNSVFGAFTGKITSISNTGFTLQNTDEEMHYYKIVVIGDRS